jgi:hypothetical protein
MNIEDGAFLTGLVLGLGVAVFVGIIACSEGVSSVQQQAVDNGHAAYDGKTKEFKWLPVAEVPE